MLQILDELKNKIGFLMNMNTDQLEIAGENFGSRLFLGTGKFESGDILRDAVLASKSELVTVAMKRANPQGINDSILDSLDLDQVKLSPNTSGVRDAKEAVLERCLVVKPCKQIG